MRVGIEDPVKQQELKELLELSSKFNERVAAQKKSRAEGAARQQEMLEIEEMRARKKHVLLQLFTKSGEAKLPGILAHLTTFLDDPLSGKVRLKSVHLYECIILHSMLLLIKSCLRLLISLLYILSKLIVIFHPCQYCTRINIP